MKRTIPLLLCLLAVMCTYAGVDCTDVMIKAQDLFEEAKELFLSISNDSDCRELYNDICTQWIIKCDRGVFCAKQMNNAVMLWREKRFEEAKNLFSITSNDSICGELFKADCSLWIKRCEDGVSCAQEMDKAKKLFREKNYEEAKKLFSSISNDSICGELYKSDCNDWIKKIPKKPNNPIPEAPPSVQKPESSESKNIAIHIVSSDKNSHIATRIKTWLTASFINAGKKYKVQENDDELSEFLKKYENPKEKNESSGKSKTQSKKSELDKVCYVMINDINEKLQFDCRFIDVNSISVENTAVYPRPDKEDIKVKSSSDVDMVQWVANVLAWQLGLLSEEPKLTQEREPKEGNKPVVDTIVIDTIHPEVPNRDMKLVFFPGRYQIHYGRETENRGLETLGYIIKFGCYAGALGGIGCQIGIEHYKNKKTTYPDQGAEYNDKIQDLKLFRCGSFVVAGLFYIGNWAHALCTITPQKHNKKNNRNTGTVSLNPVITDESIVLTLNINF